MVESNCFGSCVGSNPICASQETNRSNSPKFVPVMVMRLGKQSDKLLQTDCSYERANKGETGELISLWEKCNQFHSIYHWNADKIDSPVYDVGNNVEF